MAGKTAMNSSEGMDVEIICVTKPVSPPVLGAILKVCQEGENAGRRYWCVQAENKYGGTKLAFFEWVDKDPNDTKEVLKRMEGQIRAHSVALDSIAKSFACMKPGWPDPVEMARRESDRLQRHSISNVSEQ